jgi:CelD/BcsL family acetyltransferase involved in cellulose biosynthesis
MGTRLLPLTEVGKSVMDAWGALAERSLEPNPYLEPEPVLAAGRLMDGGSTAAVLLVERGADALFALPVIRRAALHHVPVPALTTWLHPHAYLGTPLIDPDEPTAAWEAVFDLLARARLTPRVALTLLPADGPTRVALDRALAARRLPATVLDPTVRAMLARRPTATYLDGRMSSRHRKQLRRKRRLLSERLGTEMTLVDRAEPDADVTAAVEDFLRMEASGWKGRAGTAMACKPGHAEYFRRLCGSFHRRGRLQLLTLAAGEENLAMVCLVVGGSVAFHMKIAYDEAYADCSPGLQLELELITAFHQDPRQQWIDSGSDDPDSVSARLYPEQRTLDTVLIPTHGLPGRAASRFTPAVLAAGRLAKRLPSRLVRAGAPPAPIRTIRP